MGVTYAIQLSAEGGAGDLVWTLGSGELPPDLSLSQSGLISGVSGFFEHPRTFDPSVRVTDSAGRSDSADLSMYWYFPTPLVPTQIWFDDVMPGEPVEPMELTFRLDAACGGTAEWTASQESSWVIVEPSSGLLNGDIGTAMVTLDTDNLPDPPESSGIQLNLAGQVEYITVVYTLAP
jgi:hypothetical protein